MIGIAQHLIEPALLGFARKERNPQRLRVAHLARNFRQHGDAARYVKAADTYGEVRVEEWPREINGPRKLIGLHTNQRDHRPPPLAYFTNDLVRPHAAIGFIKRMEMNCDTGTEDFARLGILREPVQACQCIGWKSRSKPLNGIPIVVVMGRLDHYQMEHAWPSARRDFWRLRASVPSLIALLNDYATPIVRGHPSF